MMTFQIGQLRYVAALAALLLTLSACEGGGGGQQVLTWEQLENAAYPVEFAEPDGIAQLEDGEFRQQATPGSATQTVVRLAEIRSFGRIDNGSSIDAAPILIVDPGGSGTFIFLVAALNIDGQPEMAATILLGDRVAVRSLKIVDSQIVVGMRVRGPDDPFAYLTTEVTRTYALEGSDLVLLSEETSIVPPPSPSDYGFEPERIEVDEGEKETVMGRLAPGELGDHVLGGEAGQELQVALRSQFSNAILSIYGLTDGQVLVSVTEFKVQFTDILPSNQDYAIRVVTLAGDELDYRLDIQLQGRPSTSPPPSSSKSPTPDTLTATPEAVAPTATSEAATPAATPEAAAPTATPEAAAPTATPEAAAPTATPEAAAPVTPTQASPVSGVQPPSGGGLFVYLTFDDGPSAPFTGQVLDLLARFNAKGTFFALGTNAQTMPELTRRAALEGHSFGNHTMSHGSLQGIDHDAFFNEVTAAQSVIDELVGAASTRCLRPPYGATDSFTRAYAAELGYAVVLWDVDPRDWARPGVDKIVSSIVEGSGPGRIILMHDGGGDRTQTVAALEQVLIQLSDQGYAFEPLSCA